MIVIDEKNNRQIVLGKYRLMPWQGCFLLLLLVYAVVILLTFQDYGITVDEYSHIQYGTRVIQWYTSFFQDRGIFSRANVWLYGGWYDAVEFLLIQVSPLNPFDTRHLCNAVVGLLGVVAAYKLGCYLGGGWAGCLAAIFLLLTPRYYGHAFNNHKDVPFAVAYLWGVYCLIRSLGYVPNLPHSWIWKTGLAIGLSMGIRVGGVILVVPLVGFFLFRYHQAGMWKNGKVFSRPTRSFLFQTGSIFLIAYFTMLIFWPWAQTNPLVHPYRALTVFSRFPDRHISFFEGRYIQNTDIPWYYAPKWLVLTLPEFVFAGLLAGAIYLVVFRPGSGLRTLQWGVLVFSAVFPLGYVAAVRTPIYDGIRHILFIVLPLVVLSALGISEVAGRLRNWRRHGVVLLIGGFLVHTVAEMLMLHPNQYVYFNRLFAGGIQQASLHYSTDYWYNSYKQAVRWMDAHYVDLILDLNLSDKPRIASGTSNTRFLLDPRRFEYVKTPGEADLYLVTTHLEQHTIVPGKVIHTVRANGVPLLYIIDPDSSYQNDPFFMGSSAIWMEQRGLFHEAAGHKDKALAVYLKGLEVDPSNAFLHARIGNLYQDAGRYDEALVRFESALLLDPHAPDVYSDVGSCYYHLGRFEDAIRLYRQALDFHPYFVRAFRGLAEVYLAQSRYEDVIRQTRKILDILPEAMFDLHRLGLAYYRVGRVDEAEAAYRKVAENVPDNAQVWFNLGVLLHERGRQDEAIDVFRKAIQVQPEYWNAYLGLGELLEKAGRLEEADRILSRLVATDARQYDGWLFLARVRRRLGDISAADRAVRKALEGRPSRAEYWAEYFMVGKQFEDLGQADRAMAIYRAVVGARPQDAEARDRLLRLSQ